METLLAVDNSTPQAFIAINKNRLKSYNQASTYYLKDKTEFQLELYNPKSVPVLAKIKINGKVISQGGLVLKPAQRIYLERYMDVAKKFLFETYTVDGNDSQVQQAIKNNGDIEIEFFDEKVIYDTNLTWTNQGFNPNPYGDWYNYNTNICGGPLGHNAGIGTNSYYSNSSLGSNQTNVSYSTSLNLNQSITSTNTQNNNSVSRGLETGRIEKGSRSNQKFETVDMEFNYFACKRITFKLLPESQKINTTDDIKHKLYCHSCGSKIGKNYKYCPYCSIKI